MFLCNFLHFYQPYNQQDDILDRIVHESYLPVLQGLLARPSAKLVFNINGVLVRLLRDKGYAEVLDILKQLVDRGQVELTGSAMFHAFLPLLPEEEIIRQIDLNAIECAGFFGDSFSPTGFFSPEMAVNDKVLKVVAKLGFKWIAAPQVAYGSKEVVPDKLFKDAKTGLFVFFRNKRVSSLILSAVAKSAESLVTETKDILNVHKYWFTVMDGETFGHHRVGHEALLLDIVDSSHFECVTASALLEMSAFDIEEVCLRPSTWTNEEQDFWVDPTSSSTALGDFGKSFVLWKDPGNPIHILQWAFVDFVLNELRVYSNREDSSWQQAREKMDMALASDQFWWASTKPWWSLEVVEQGAFMLMDVLETLNVPSSIRKKGKEFYRKILDQAFEWQRTGYIRKRHLEDSATFMKDPFKRRTPAEWYNQIVLEFEDEMKKAAEKKDFEKAIKWRDALIKLEKGTDMYDVLHVVDELWSARKIPEVKPFLKHEWEEFSDFAKEQFRAEGGGVGELDSDGFEDWKKPSDGAKSTP